MSMYSLIYKISLSASNGIRVTKQRDRIMNMSSTVERVYLSDEDDNGDWEIIVSFLIRLVVYVTILVVLVVVVSLILKFLNDCNNEAAAVEEESETRRERNRLLPNLKDSNSDTYGTMEEADDLEYGNSGSSSSSEESYDVKICIICYDQQRNCFFVPCGHSASCYDCAQRIRDGEGKTCPVCRRLVHKVRKFFTS